MKGMGRVCHGSGKVEKAGGAILETGRTFAHMMKNSDRWFVDQDIWSFCTQGISHLSVEDNSPDLAHISWNFHTSKNSKV